ncbi:hypothetical protein M0R19_03425 [Candidatus Pacearchaeota archaeon]|jgi:hypothetical protein|nr:hypothetical protein [Candidatus Pacearchaeota archaeon]
MKKNDLIMISFKQSIGLGLAGVFASNIKNTSSLLISKPRYVIFLHIDKGTINRIKYLYFFDILTKENFKIPLYKSLLIRKK